MAPRKLSDIRSVCLSQASREAVQFCYLLFAGEGLSACLRRHAKLFSSAVCCSQVKDCLSVCLRRYAKLLSSAVCCSQVKGCLPAMGYSFAAGTTDGPGSFTFRQGMKTENPLWNVVRNFLSPPTECDVTCHAPKPILLATGQVRALYLLFILKVFF